MTEQERYKKYVKEHCKNCANKDKDLCEVKIINKVDSSVITKCEHYENENPKKWKKKLINL